MRYRFNAAGQLRPTMTLALVAGGMGVRPTAENVGALRGQGRKVTGESLAAKAQRVEELGGRR
jgi:hypothetical protein